MFIDKIFENLNKCNINSGIVIASPSKKNPDYFYHWTRDSALVMKTICKYYKETKDNRCFKQIINYIDLESHHQKLDTLSGLGEPKFNVDKKEYSFHSKFPVHFDNFISKFKFSKILNNKINFL